jgi:hypothetical protein
MPKETIHPSVPVEDAKELNLVDVGWHNNGHVAIGVRPAGQAGPEDGLFADLDRDQINKLIRTLRRARDAAYGADA